MTTATFDRAQVVLGKRYPRPDEGQTVRYGGQVWRRVGDEWLLDKSRVSLAVARLEEADGLWRSEAAKRIGMRHVYEILTAAWKQCDE